jgi:hypothetical protein
MALQDKKYSIAQDQMDLVESRRKEIKTSLENLQEIVREKNEKLEEQKTQLENDNAVATLWNGGVKDPTEIYNQMIDAGYTGMKLEDIVAVTDKLKEKITEKPTSYQEWELAGGQEGTGKTYAEFLTKEKEVSFTERQQALKTAALAKVKEYFNQWKAQKMGGYGTWESPEGGFTGYKPPEEGWDKYVSPDDYLTLRSEFASLFADASLFDEVFASYLSPQERERLGIGKESYAAPKSGEIDFNNL